MIMVGRRKDVGPFIALVREGPSDSATSGYVLKWQNEGGEEGGEAGVVIEY